MYNLLDKSRKGIIYVKISSNNCKDLMCSILPFHCWQILLAYGWCCCFHNTTSIVFNYVKWVIGSHSVYIHRNISVWAGKETQTRKYERHCIHWIPFTTVSLLTNGGVLINMTTHRSNSISCSTQFNNWNRITVIWLSSIYKTLQLPSFIYKSRSSHCKSFIYHFPMARNNFPQLKFNTITIMGYDFFSTSLPHYFNWTYNYTDFPI